MKGIRELNMFKTIQDYLKFNVEIIVKEYKTNKIINNYKLSKVVKCSLRAKGRINLYV